jgi:hypothetical protein
MNHEAMGREIRSAEAPAASACARCGSAFHCGAKDGAACWCVMVPTDKSALPELSRRYSGCLCEACLKAVAVRP